MKRRDTLKIVSGSGHVFRKLGRINADAEQFKAILAAELIKALDRQRRPAKERRYRVAFSLSVLTASATVIITVIGSIGEAIKPWR